MQAKLHHNRPRVPQILRPFLVMNYVLHASAQVGASLKEVTRWSWQIWQEACEKKKLEPENLIFAKPGLSEFHESRKKQSLYFFLQSRASLSFIRAVWKKQFFRAWKAVFLQSHACMIFVRLVRKKQLFGDWKIAFLQSLASKSFMRAVWKKFGAWKKLFCKASVFFKLSRKTMFQVPSQAYPHLDFGRIVSSPSTREKNIFLGAWKIVFLQSPVCG